MRYLIDHDYHIHSHLSTCSQDDGQTPLAMLEYAARNNLRKICVTDHYWDGAVKCNTAYNWWYVRQNFEHISQNLPLPPSGHTQFLFGCETDMDSDYNVGIPKERYDDFCFIIISTTHFHHMAGAEWENPTNHELSQLWIKRMDALLKKDLPFGKVGIAHPACSLINQKSRKDYVETLDLIESDELERIFTRVAKLGAGVEINMYDMRFSDDEKDSVLRMFRIAKKCGCKFYLGSDAHERVCFKSCTDIFERAVNMLELKEDDKFEIGR